jgi:hypothetical protein
MLMKAGYLDILTLVINIRRINLISVININIGGLVTFVIKGHSVKAAPLSELLSKVTVSDKTPDMFKMLANYQTKSKLVVKKSKRNKSDK